MQKNIRLLSISQPMPVDSLSFSFIVILPLFFYIQTSLEILAYKDLFVEFRLDRIFSLVHETVSDS